MVHRPHRTSAAHPDGAGLRPSRAASEANLPTVVLACLLACMLVLTAPSALWADAPQTGSDPVTDAEPDELQQLVEETAAAYNEAVAQREELEQQVADCEARIAELEAQLPAAQEAAADAIYVLYRFYQSDYGLIELLLSADDFNSFITTIQYLNSVNNHIVGQLEELVALSNELDAERENLEAALAAAREQEAVAEEALAEAQAAREEAQRRAAEEAAREQAEREAAAAAAQAQTDATGTDGTGTSSEDGTAETTATDAEVDGSASSDTGDDASSSTDGEDVVWSERDTFVAEWGARIDAYLSGSPLAGYGSTFAAAAWDYGVDPRWSPAIAYVESSLGLYCFLPYNAWGWGSVSWSSWEEAIYSHVAGLARGYGYTITYEAAQRYCPSNADYWYSTVSTQMSYI